MECGPSQAEEEHLASADAQEEKVVAAELPSFTSVESLQEWIANDVNTACSFSSPWGRVPLVYADHTASNRPMKSIERYLEHVCLPLYGNTHTNTSLSGSQSTAFVAEARQIIAEATNAKITGKASTDVVLFAGSGATAAVELLIDCLGLSATSKDDNRPIIFVGPYEHHSNLIPWRETGCEVVMVPESNGTVDLEFLEMQLAQQGEMRLKMGTFTAASNVTGKLCDVVAIATLLHKYDALAFFDYATASSYTKIDMNPINGSADAIFLSPHKLLGGVGTPGILIVKKHLVSQVNAPKRSGGGTVFYVTESHHRFLSHRVERYEGGTPMIPGIVRAGLTLLLKRQIERLYDNLKPQQNLLDHDINTRTRVVQYLAKHAPELVVLGANDPGPHLPIASFLIRCGQRFLHYNFVCAILNDVFGIQSRGGCQCAGPYSQVLLGLSNSEANAKIEMALYKYKERAELLRPGYTRVSFPFKGMRHAEMEYILKALVWVAKHGWALLCHYRCNHRTGEWRHATRQGRPLGRDERRWLSRYQIGSDPPNNVPEASQNLQVVLDGALEHADEVLASALSDQKAIAEAAKMVNADNVLGGDNEDDLESLRWYVYPQECAKRLLAGDTETNQVSTSILGAIRPNNSNVKPVSAEISLGKTGADETKDSKKRKIPSDIPAFNRMHCFRDGDYTGEATMDEIAKGVDDGELSNKSQIFHTGTGEWVSFEEFRRHDHEKFFDVEAVPGRNTINVPESVQGFNPKKRAPRTSSEWGSKVNNTVDHLKNKAPMDMSKSKNNKKKRFLHETPPPKLMRLANQAIMQWEMIKEGDKLLLGLSGGKDSLSLLHCLMELRRKLPIKFDLEVCTIDPMTDSFDPSPLIPYVESLGLKYHYIKEEIVDRANEAGKSGKMVSSLCAYCARMKRGLLYTCARQNNCNKLVLAQHLDDCAESVMMSMMHNGLLRTMKAHYTIDSGDLAVIRPLVYCRESLMTDFAKKSNLPIINENCPACFEEPKERARIKKMLSREETLYPNVYDNIRRALVPLMHDDAVPILRSFAEEALSRSRKDEKKQNSNTVVESVRTNSDSAEMKVKDMSDSDLLRELARRRNHKHASPKSKRKGTALACSINSKAGDIPCYELME